MIKTFSDRHKAENDLYDAGFRVIPGGTWIKPGFVATIHPVQVRANALAVRVAIRENLK